MTNKEKAREIAGGRYAPISEYEAGKYDGALEMAGWKDRQFKECLEKKLKDNTIPIMGKVSKRGFFHIVNASHRRGLLREIINELSEI